MWDFIARNRPTKVLPDLCVPLRIWDEGFPPNAEGFPLFLLVCGEKRHGSQGLLTRLLSLSYPLVHRNHGKFPVHRFSVVDCVAVCSRIFVSLLVAFPEVLPHQAHARCQAEAEQAYPSLDQTPNW